MYNIFWYKVIKRRFAKSNLLLSPKKMSLTQAIHNQLRNPDHEPLTTSNEPMSK